MSDTWFALHRDSVLVILAMAAVTYAFRGGGYWLMGRVTLSPRMETGLTHLPGAVITALVVPSMLEAGFAGVLGVMVVAVCMRIRPNLLFAMVAGIFTVWLLRQFL